MTHVIEQTLEVDRIQRLRDQNKVQLVLIPVPGSEHPWQEHYLTVDPIDETPTGTRYVLTSEYAIVSEAE